jgi:xylan 1,4-beta-xylosidase
MMRLILILSSFLSSLAVANDDSATFIYQNPISEGIDSKGLRDCQVIRDGDQWFLTGTAWPHWPRQETKGILNPGVPLYSSPDLKRWKFESIIVPRGEADVWHHRRFWAPEIQKIGGKYFALFNASNPDRGFPGQHTGYAVADSIRGPYTVVTKEKPLSNGNDLTFFEDDDGSVWAFWNRGREFGIGFAKIDLSNATLLTEPKTAILPGEVEMAFDKNGKPVMEADYDGRQKHKIAKHHAWDSIGIEGAYVIKREEIYYLFYSSWTRGYEIGYATAPAVTGPWTKAAHNPVYGSQSEAACKRAGLPYTANPENPFNQVGHNQVFAGPDGKPWLSCHGILKSKPDQPMLVIDPIPFLKDGTIPRFEPGYRERRIALPSFPVQ